MLKRIVAGLGAVWFGLAGAADEPMQQHQTTRCSRHGQPEFQFSVAKRIPEQDVKWLVKTLEDWVEGGERFKDGETVQVGWMMLKLEKAGPQTLRLLEPDMKSFPIRFVDSVTATLAALRSQKDAIESIAPQPPIAFPQVGHAVFVHPKFKNAKDLLLMRGRPQGNASGWIVTDAQDERPLQAQGLKLTSLYQLALDRPDLVKFMAFPEGYQVLAGDGKKIVVLLNGKAQQMRAGSFLERLNARN